MCAVKTSKQVKKEKQVKAEATGRPTGKTSKCSIRDTWCAIFKKNESLPRAKKLTDDAISEYMHSEFPGQQVLAFDRVSDVRSLYNRGGLTKGVVPPESSQYDKTGNRIAKWMRKKEAKAEKKAKAKKVVVVSKQKKAATEPVDSKLKKVADKAPGRRVVVVSKRVRQVEL